VRADASVGFSNARGDVRSRTAALHSGLAVRLYTLAEFVLEQKLSTAAWSAWNALLMGVLGKAEQMKQRALFRLPRVYRYSVRYLIASAIVTDTFILGARAGRLIKYSADHWEWAYFAWFGSSAVFVITCLAAYFVMLLIQGLSMMEQPFGCDTLDMPGLSYVSAAAEMSLRTVACAPASQKQSGTAAAPTGKEVNIMSVLQALNEDDLLHDVGNAVEGTPHRVRVRRRSSVGGAPRAAPPVPHTGKESTHGDDDE
jgi:uncharacterized membrane protein YedE/YeeE